MVAFMVPLRRDKVDAWKAWVRELMTTRKGDFDAFNARHQITRHDAWLQEDVPAVIVVQDGPGASDMIERVKRSPDPFDRWFLDRITDLHGVDFRATTLKPNPPSLQWQATPTKA